MQNWSSDFSAATPPARFVRSDGRPLDGSGRYAVRFEAGALPQVEAYWSVTYYALPGRNLLDHASLF